MKLAHRPRIASTTIKLISKPNFTVHFINFIKNNSANRDTECPKHRPHKHARGMGANWCCHLADQFLSYYFLYCLHPHIKPGLHFERKSTAHTQTILRTRGAFSRPPMPIYAVGIAQVPSVNTYTPTIRRLLRVNAGLSLASSPQPMRIRKLLPGI